MVAGHSGLGGLPAQKPVGVDLRAGPGCVTVLYPKMVELGVWGSLKKRRNVAEGLVDKVIHLSAAKM